MGNSINELRLYDFWKKEVRKIFPSNKVRQTCDLSLAKFCFQWQCLVTEAAVMVAGILAAPMNFFLFSVSQLRRYDPKAKSPAFQ